MRGGVVDGGVELAFHVLADADGSIGWWPPVGDVHDQRQVRTRSSGWHETFFLLGRNTDTSSRQTPTVEGNRAADLPLHRRRIAMRGALLGEHTHRWKAGLNTMAVRPPAPQSGTEVRARNGAGRGRAAL